MTKRLKGEETCRNTAVPEKRAGGVGGGGATRFQWVLSINVVEKRAEFESFEAGLEGRGGGRSVALPSFLPCVILMHRQ